MVIENSKGDKKQIYYSNPKSKSVNSIIEDKSKNIIKDEEIKRKENLLISLIRSRKF